MEDWQEYERCIAAAEKQAAQVPFTTRNNPLATMTPAQAAEAAIVERNMQALRRDRDNRENPAIGAVYSGIMNMRYGG